MNTRIALTALGGVLLLAAPPPSWLPVFRNIARDAGLTTVIPNGGDT